MLNWQHCEEFRASQHHLDFSSCIKLHMAVFAPYRQFSNEDLSLAMFMHCIVWKSIHMDWILEESETCWRPLDGPITERKARKSKGQREVVEEGNSHSFCRFSPPLLLVVEGNFSTVQKKFQRMQNGHALG